jgi:hypothetical protein
MEKLIKKPTQCERVLKILQDAEWRWVDGMTFLRLDHPITQYHARIFELQEQGHNIESRFIEGKNWKEYKIIPRGTLF